jgi:hypothetical protein
VARQDATEAAEPDRAALAVAGRQLARPAEAEAAEARFRGEVASAATAAAARHGDERAATAAAAAALDEAAVDDDEVVPGLDRRPAGLPRTVERGRRDQSTLATGATAAADTGAGLEQQLDRGPRRPDAGIEGRDRDRRAADDVARRDRAGHGVGHVVESAGRARILAQVEVRLRCQP